MLTAIVCAYNEERLLPAARIRGALARAPDEILVVNSSTDGTRGSLRVPGVRVVTSRARTALARAAGRRAAMRRHSVLHGRRPPGAAASARARRAAVPQIRDDGCRHGRIGSTTGTDRRRRRALRHTLALLAHRSRIVFGIGAVLYGGNFAVRASALDEIGGFDTSIEFQQTNLGRRLASRSPSS
jgi:hypothetical protein